MAGVKVIANDTEFQPELSAAGSRLAVVKFTMRGCGPCLRIAPAFNALSNKYPQATFLEVDVHQCQGTAATNNISATPTFLFFRNKVRIDQYQGADAVGLEDKIKQHLENDPGNSEDTDIPKGYMDLLPFINKAGCECLNESDEHGFENCLRKDSSYLESDCDEQLLITVAFSQPVKLYSMKLQGPDNGQGPKSIPGTVIPIACVCPGPQIHPWDCNSHSLCPRAGPQVHPWDCNSQSLCVSQAPSPSLGL
ncbi:thioredoxin-like protein 1 isoform X2 [Melozone crissalis]|uniref:thioredoxin-like protein 1 isoform X2 n=1 Tax=Melozone crissalis TaxID=40204 RepID=UPI0023DA2053|nr:thioredoxin-like protein 1 isoform X2 [Melozone crissalis]